MIFGADNFIVGADVKEEKIHINGWLQATDINVFDFIKQQKVNGINKVFCTDISKDGLLEGPSIELYKKIIGQNPDIYFIASGGVAMMSDIDELKKINCSAVIVGKAIYEGRITMKELEQFHKT
jgi:phosphoribosylformimino-5-aminoimidazole carboxamide ribotide isomerase